MRLRYPIYLRTLLEKSIITKRNPQLVYILWQNLFSKVQTLTQSKYRIYTQERPMSGGNWVFLGTL